MQLAKCYYKHALESSLEILRTKEVTPFKVFEKAFACGGAILWAKQCGEGVKSTGPEVISCPSSNPGSTIYWVHDFQNLTESL